MWIVEGEVNYLKEAMKSVNNVTTSSLNIRVKKMECRQQDPPVAVIPTEDTSDSGKHVQLGPGHHGAVPLWTDDIVQCLMSIWTVWLSTVMMVLNCLEVGLLQVMKL